MVIFALPFASGALNLQEQEWVDSVSILYGQRAGKKGETWRQLLVNLNSLPEEQQLSEVNIFFNQLNFVDAIPLILNNIDLEIKLATVRQDLLPIYSFNGRYLWLMKEKGRGKLLGNSSRLSLWNDVRTRRDSLTLKKLIRSYDL